ncbi:unnamed protein product [Staurois parvus]|uniref:Uncharacterized protein n=1 Tax=Staurois parvus TaxID=386267 RepID=A0ABN9CN58_9NEOB|nr:unnamed protein product [Staurois parvus]
MFFTEVQSAYISEI